VCLMMRGHSVHLDGRPTHPLSFLEGDELGVIDGRRAIAGTGTEDYFDDAFFFEGGATATPFAQAWAIGRDEGGRGHACACRWHLLGDAIDFRRSLELSIEMGPDLPAMVDRYRSVAFVYR